MSYRGVDLPSVLTLDVNVKVKGSYPGAALPENSEAIAKLTTADEMTERLPRAQPDSVANHVTARSISD